ncbi:DUF4148 domain-containing protein [Caenimonas terrae]|uniref:DUF4148 domain-containing protein n=1 Tax=Caenimonas terrae TaxID=696074 RepID=A0ABW0N8L3_9BURK
MISRKFATALVLAATAVAGNAFADDITVDTTPFVSARTRAEVQADLGQFKQSGTSPWSIQYNPLRSFKSGTTRAEVTAQYVNSRDQVAALNSEDSGSAYLAQYRVRNAGTTLAGQPQTNAQ